MTLLRLASLPRVLPRLHGVGTSGLVTAAAAGAAGAAGAAAGGGNHASATPPPLLLLRDFIARSLSAYFASAAPVGSGAGLPPLSSLADRAAYTRALAAVYAANPPGAWLTPSELFSPHYARAVAAFILGHHAAHRPRGSPLHIVEVGSGRGTLARDVLDAVRAADGGSGGGARSGVTPPPPSSALYSRTVYVTLDVSPGLAAVARDTVAAAGHGPAVFRQAVGDACEASGWAAAAATLESAGGAAAAAAAAAAATTSPPIAPYIIACELLDNLPHDRVEKRAGGGWVQAMVRWQAGSGAPPREELHPLTDRAIVACLEAALEEGGGGGGSVPPPPSLLARLADWAVGEAPPPWAPLRPTHPTAARCLFLPTGAARFLGAAAAAFPGGHTLLALDFDALPNAGGGEVLGRWRQRRRQQGGAPTSPHACCWGAPLVSGPPTPGAAAVDYPHILAVDPPGTADIFFPTDFALIARLARRVGGGCSDSGVATHVMKAADFMRAHSPALGATATASGWNPLVDDFTNTSAVIVERRGV